MHARAVADAAISSLDSEVVATIGTDPRAGAAILGLSVEALAHVPARGSGGWCDGASFVDEGRIVYRPTAGLRENFTICHELGHHLLREDDAAMDWVYDHEDADAALEELCDKFAAAVLVPGEMVDQVVDAYGFTAEAVVELFGRSSASRHCCAIALVDRLPSRGFIAIIDASTMQVWATAKKADTSPVAYRGQPIPGAHPLGRLDDDSPHIRTKAWWPLGPNDRWDYYVDARRDGMWDIAVFVERDLWEVEQLHIGREERERHVGEVRCPCGFSGETPWFPCGECGSSPCPRCRKCACDWREKREQRVMCSGCFQTVRAHLVVEDLCDACRG